MLAYGKILIFSHCKRLRLFQCFVIAFKSKD